MKQTGFVLKKHTAVVHAMAISVCKFHTNIVYKEDQPCIFSTLKVKWSFVNEFGGLCIPLSANIEKCVAYH